MPQVLDAMDQMLVHYSKTQCSPYSGHDIIMGPDCAFVLLREVRAALGELGNQSSRRIEISSDRDEMCIYRGIKVRIRMDCPAANVFVVKSDQVRPPTCCDQAAMRMLWAFLQQGSA